MYLKDAHVGETRIVESMELPFELEHRLEALGMTTGTPVSVLEDDKRALLEEGIYVEGRDRLNRILEDYTS